MQDVHIGPLPPPPNGGSMYLYRLSKIDKKAIFLDSDSNEFKSNRKFLVWCLKQIFNFKRKNFIFHHPRLLPKFYLYFLSCVSFHNFSLVLHGNPLLNQYNKLSSIYRSILKKVLNRAKFIQVVNPTYKAFLNLIKVKNKNVFVKNAFLPPPLEEEDRIIRTYGKDLIEFLDNKNPIIVANAASLIFYQGVDLYGLDMTIELIKLLKPEFPNIGLLFALANDNINRAYLNEIIKKIEDYDLKSNYYLMTGKELWPIFKKADLMVRPTNRDGYGSSVAEALFFNCPAVASDVCKRPKGTVLFKNRDLRDFFNKCQELLKNKQRNLGNEQH